MSKITTIEPSAFQIFKDRTGSRLKSLQPLVCPETGKKFVLWSDIQSLFKGVVRIENDWQENVLFMVNLEGKLNNADFPTVSEVMQRIEGLYVLCIALYGPFESGAHGDRHRFIELWANIDLYHSSMRADIEQLVQAGVDVTVRGHNPERIFQGLELFDRQALYLDNVNTSWDMLRGLDRRWDFATSLLFIVLPSDIRTWKESDRSTHRFRIHFLCDMSDTKKEGKRPNTHTQHHVHLSNHPGYNLLRPQEFFKTHGDYVLRVLWMIKQGYTDDVYKVPALETLEILWGCDPSLTGRFFSKTLTPLVEYAIGYLQKLLGRKRYAHASLTDKMSFAINSHLELTEGDNGSCGLHRTSPRYRGTTWRCAEHAKQDLDSDALESLMNFVRDHDGQINMQKAKLKVALTSETEADRFRSLLVGAKHPFDITIVLLWISSQECLRNLCRDVSQSQALTLFLDGVTPEMLSQTPVKDKTDFFANVGLETDLPIVLLNYPDRKQQTIYAINSSIQTRMSQTSHSDFGWTLLKRYMHDFSNLVFKPHSGTTWIDAAGKVVETLDQLGLSNVSEISVYSSECDGVIDLHEGAFTEIHSFDGAFPKSLGSPELIRQLTQDRSELDSGYELRRILPNNPDLVELNLSTLGYSIFRQIEHIGELWTASLRPLRVTFFERLHNGQGRIVAQLIFQGSSAAGRDNIDTNTIFDTTSRVASHQHLLSQIEVVNWESEYRVAWPDDRTAYILRRIVRQQPLILGAFTLSISHLSRAGLASVRRILGDSSLEHLRLVCTPVDDPCSENLAQALQCIPWSTLRSLVITGRNMDSWISRFSSCIKAPRLLSLTLRGPEPGTVKISHPSALALHQLVFSSQMVEFDIENITLQDKSDWILLVDGLKVWSIDTLTMCPGSIEQFLSVPLAIIPFLNSFFHAGVKARLSLGSFELNTSTMVQNQDFLGPFISFCKLYALKLTCTTVDFSQFESIVEMLRSGPWSTLRVLVLTGENLNMWAWFLTSIEMPCLESLELSGAAGQITDQLTPTTIKFVDHILNDSPLEKLMLQNVVLQRQEEWVRIVESLDYPRQRLHLGRLSKAQYQSCAAAKALMGEKVKRQK
ncbi:hypothetical protein BG004_003940 [Podila humilis]|nr:hypothetical protein BG004_003940 [Podila humilis]